MKTEPGPTRTNVRGRLLYRKNIGQKTRVREGNSVQPIKKNQLNREPAQLVKEKGESNVPAKSSIKKQI